MRRATLLFGLALLLAVPLAHARSTVVPNAGFYDCRHRDLTYYSDILLRANGTYVQGFVDSSGRRFKAVIGKGVFTRSGSRLTFRSGPLRRARLYGVVKTSRKFSLWISGERTYSEYCYYTSKN